MPLFPNLAGLHPEKASVVASFEYLGTFSGQPLVSEAGQRLFWGHTRRVTGAQTWAAMGIEINKIRILVRSSGDTILRYVAEAPLKSLSADLVLAPSASSNSSSLPSGPCAPGSTSVAIRARVRMLDVSMLAMEAAMQAQSQDIVGIVAGFARPDDRVSIQNTRTAAVHYARSNDDGHIVCG